MFLVAVSACWVLAYDTTIRSMAGPVDNPEAVYGLAAERAFLEAWLLFLASWFRTVPIWLSFVSAFAFFYLSICSTIVIMYLYAVVLSWDIRYTIFSIK